MKRYLLIGLIIFSYSFLVGCASTRSPTLNTDLTQERWMQSVDSNPMMWVRGADRWFLTGDPNSAELANRNAPYSAAISTMMIHVPNFHFIQSNGDFQVQIFGTYGANSVFIYGPNEAVRETTVEMRGNTLCIGQTKRSSYNMRKVIIRIGVNQLNGLTQLGRGCIEGIQIHSNGLFINTIGNGNIYLRGNVNLQRVTNAGRGSVNVFGANTSALDIKTTGTGSVNISGNVGVRQIHHYNRNDINIIGAYSNGLKIYTEGTGKIGIRGSRINLCNVVTRGNTCVYVIGVGAGSLYAYAYDASRIGVSGATDNLYVDTYKSARFEGRYLCARSAFVRAHDWSHINVTATDKIFAAATQNASVYFFGSPTIMSQFVNGNGVVIPIWYENMRVCPVATVYPFPHVVKKRRVSYKAEYKAERVSPRFAGQG